ncbi:MAG: hypothetical protein EXS05_09470 [Planctomycetaceae bacterium]|nr:hypothetical protein [Planctomycetaceae bacterium]
MGARKKESRVVVDPEKQGTDIPRSPGGKPIPLIREAINELTKGLIGVRVRGPIKDPQAEVRPFLQLDEALKNNDPLAG